MNYISERSAKLNLKKYGYSKIDSSTTEAFNTALKNYTKNSLKKLLKKGGTVMPSEFYGVDSGKYHDTVPKVPTGVTESYIRPPLYTSDPTGFIQDGGAQERFEVSKLGFKAVLNETMSTHFSGENLKISTNAQNNLKSTFEKMMHDTLSKYNKKFKGSNEFNLAEWNKIAEMRKYSLLH